MGRFIDLTGQRFGMLTVIKRADTEKCGMVKWECECDCGNHAIVRSSCLRKGYTKSCGCYRAMADNPKGFKHGYGGKRLYCEYIDMIKRCRKTYKDHDRYYDRGIKVCDEWLPENNGMYAFMNWAEKNGYNDALTIDRIDNDGNYSPDNCRWATKKQQANNRRTTIKITIDGETKSLIEWCEFFNMNYSTVRRRYKVLGWSIERALTEPIFYGKH